MTQQTLQIGLPSEAACCFAQHAQRAAIAFVLRTALWQQLEAPTKPKAIWACCFQHRRETSRWICAPQITEPQPGTEEICAARR
mmetsp:Transcript_26073/g.62032  ORF Transcript_26073/g.62032 Transcript_26073/m.62032 type:complete len:84 (+) Transcript_26073:99-350(+)